MAHKLKRVDGYVWCDRHGEIHEESLDPYDYTDPNDPRDKQDQLCKLSDHRAVYARHE